MCAHRGHRPDTKQRFGVLFSPTGFGMNCFNCGFKARWEEGSNISKDLKDLLITVGVPKNEVNQLSFDAFFNRELASTTTGVSTIPHTEWTEAELPKGTKTILEWATEGNIDPEFINVVEYAINRGIDDFSRVAWCPQKENLLNKRLIVPFTWDNKVVGFSGRTSSSGVLRYYHEKPNHFIYNLDRQDRNQKFMIVVEGVFDALLTGGIALLHNKCSDEQAHEVNMLGINPVVCPDRDKSGDDLVEDAIRHGWSVSFPPWEYGVKDAGDAVVKYGKIFTVYSILKYSTKNPDKIRLWRKLDLEKYGNKRLHA